MSKENSKRIKEIIPKEENKDDNTKKINNNIEQKENDWIKLLNEELEKFSIGDSEEENQEKKDDEHDKKDEDETIIKEIPLDKISSPSNLTKSDTDKNDKFKKKNTISTKYNKEINQKNINFEIDNTGITKYNDSIIFEGKEFRSYSRYNIYNSKRKIKKTIFKCINIRRDEQFRRDTNQTVFCNATIEYIEPGQNIKSGYFIKSIHSDSCLSLDFKKVKEEKNKNIKLDNDKEHFIKLCNEILNNSTIYDRRLFKDEFKKIYNQNKFNFPLNDNMLSNLINNWRIHSNRFTKLSIFDNKYDYENRLILREYRVIPVEENNKKANASFEYVIYGNNENIARMRKSNHFFIDGTFHHPSDFSQLLIIMYKDCITSLKIPGLYILLNSKKEQLYDLAFHSIIKLLTNNETLNLDLQTIVTDQEKGLINSIKKNYPNVKRIVCLFHYK